MDEKISVGEWIGVKDVEGGVLSEVDEKCYEGGGLTGVGVGGRRVEVDGGKVWMHELKFGLVSFSSIYIFFLFFALFIISYPIFPPIYLSPIFHTFSLAASLSFHSLHLPVATSLHSHPVTSLAHIPLSPLPTYHRLAPFSLIQKSQKDKKIQT